MTEQERIQLIIDFVSSGKDAKEIRQELELLDAQVGKVKGSSKDLGRGVLELSQAFQDLAQGGIGGVLNNIDGVITKFGGAAGLAAGITAAAVAGKLLYDNWDNLMGLFAGSTATKEEAEAMEKLAEATKKANEQAVKMAAGVESAEKTRQKSAFRQALVDYGGSGKLLDDLSKGNAQDRLFFANEINAALKGDANSAKLLGLQSNKFNQILGNAQSAEDIAADEKENERRVKAREQRRQQEQKEDEAENERRVKKREADRKKDENTTDDLNAQGRAADNDLADEISRQFQEDQAANKVVAARRGLGRGPDADAAFQSLQRKAATFEQDAALEQARGIENGPAAQAFRAATAQMERLMEAVVQNQGDTAAAMDQLTGRLSIIEQGARKVDTKMKTLRSGGRPR